MRQFFFIIKLRKKMTLRNYLHVDIMFIFCLDYFIFITTFHSRPHSTYLAGKKSMTYTYTLKPYDLCVD